MERKRSEVGAVISDTKFAKQISIWQSLGSHLKGIDIYSMSSLRSFLTTKNGNSDIKDKNLAVQLLSPKTLQKGSPKRVTTNTI